MSSSRIASEKRRPQGGQTVVRHPTVERYRYRALVVMRSVPICLLQPVFSRGLGYSLCSSGQLNGFRATQRLFSSVRGDSRLHDREEGTTPGAAAAVDASDSAPSWALNEHQRAVLGRMIRVDHAGEIGARRIYAGQLRVLKGTPAATVIQHMAEQEERHAAVFERLVVQYRVRPTALLPLWNLAGYMLGAGTALLGREAAMACTVAVEEVIAQHYDDQLRELIAMEKQKATPEGYPAAGAPSSSPESHLRRYIRQFRDDELEHKDTGLAHGAELAPGYRLLSLVIQTGCRAAIFLSERI